MDLPGLEELEFPLARNPPEISGWVAIGGFSLIVALKYSEEFCILGQQAKTEVNYRKANLCAKRFNRKIKKWWKNSRFCKALFKKRESLIPRLEYKRYENDVEGKFETFPYDDFMVMEIPYTLRRDKKVLAEASINSLNRGISWSNNARNVFSFPELKIVK